MFCINAIKVFCLTLGSLCIGTLLGVLAQPGGGLAARCTRVLLVSTP